MARLARPIILAFGGFIAATQLAFAAGLSAADMKFLQSAFGPVVQDEIVSHMAPDELDKLHGVLNDPFTNGAPGIRQSLTADYLFAIHARQCQAWAIAHSGELCPPPADPRVLPGKNVADQQCNACHLFGTSRAPAFRTLARTDHVSEAHLADAIRAGHQMSPMYLSPGQIQALSLYINSLK